MRHAVMSRVKFQSIRDDSAKFRNNCDDSGQFQSICSELERFGENWESNLMIW